MKKETKNVLRVEKLEKEYHHSHERFSVFRPFSVTFDQGKSYAITGVSGGGKSTFLYLLAGVDIPTKGRIFFNQHAYDSFTADDKNFFLNEYIGLVFQYPYLIKELSVLENVMLKGLIGGMPEAECRKRAMHLLEQVGLAAKASHNPGQLSGGQQQRVALARALLNEPIFLLADEPTGNLDEDTGQEIMNLLLHMKKETGMGVIISSHDSYVTDQMEHVYEISHGNFIEKR